MKTRNTIKKCLYDGVAQISNFINSNVIEYAKEETQKSLIKGK
jgi:hypothetical protein